MIKTTTSSDLILYACNETNLADSDRVQRCIDGDPVVQQEFNETVEAMYAMKEIVMDPSQKSIDRILAFSRAYQA